MICDRWAVVLVPFPFIDMPVVRRRPALVLSGRAFNAEQQQSICAMITRAARSRFRSDVAIEDLTAAGLPALSFVRWKVFTIENQLINRALGKLAASDAEACSRGLAEAFS